MAQILAFRCKRRCPHFAGHTAYLANFPLGIGSMPRSQTKPAAANHHDRNTGIFCASFAAGTGFAAGPV